MLGLTLGDFSTVYLDNILVYISRSRKVYTKKVKEILRRLDSIGLALDLKKYAFTVKEVKYRGYIVKAGVRVRPDPKKLAAIRE